MGRQRISRTRAIAGQGDLRSVEIYAPGSGLMPTQGRKFCNRAGEALNSERWSGHRTWKNGTPIAEIGCGIWGSSG